MRKNMGFHGFKEFQQIRAVVIHPENADIFYVVAIGYFLGRTQKGDCIKPLTAECPAKRVSLLEIGGVVDAVMDPF